MFHYRDQFNYNMLSNDDSNKSRYEDIETSYSNFRDKLEQQIYENSDLPFKASDMHSMSDEEFANLLQQFDNKLFRIRREIKREVKIRDIRQQKLKKLRKEKFEKDLIKKNRLKKELSDDHFEDKWEKEKQEKTRLFGFSSDSENMKDVEKLFHNESK